MRTLPRKLQSLRQPKPRPANGSVFSHCKMSDHCPCFHPVRNHRNWICPLMKRFMTSPAFGSGCGPKWSGNFLPMWSATMMLCGEMGTSIELNIIWKRWWQWWTLLQDHKVYMMGLRKSLQTDETLWLVCEIVCKTHQKNHWVSRNPVTIWGCETLGINHSQTWPNNFKLWLGF